ncbi:membrane-associated protease 1 [Fusobacterium sp.]|uniref:membrane-associated protease 1 n=1 Tax=Fusobacterium sp. TaxID=68766 RepID=UPI0025C3FCEC|nr:membrane-associated protease 1 [Fusobacterium sp.]
MGFRLNIKGEEEIALGMDNILEASYKSDTPDDSDARATDLGVIITVKGKIITPVNGEEADDTRKLAKWSLVSAEKSDAYRDLVLEVISGSVVVRNIHLPNAFVVDYQENYNDKGGVGEFYAVFKQKKEKTEDVTMEGGYATEE